MNSPTLAEASVPTVVSTTLHQAKRHRRTSSSDELDRSTAAFGARVREDSRASTPAPLGMSLRIRIRLPSRWPAPNKPTTDTMKRQGPAEQPGTIAPELLPDREANVNGSRKAGHTGSARIARQASRSEGSPGPTDPPPRDKTTLPPFLIALNPSPNIPAPNCETRKARPVPKVQEFLRARNPKLATNAFCAHFHAQHVRARNPKLATNAFSGYFQKKIVYSSRFVRVILAQGPC